MDGVLAEGVTHAKGLSTAAQPACKTVQSLGRRTAGGPSPVTLGRGGQGSGPCRPLRGLLGDLTRRSADLVGRDPDPT